MSTLKINVTDKVQGVFFRRSAKDIADELGMTGWIRNNADGSVEAMINGSRESTSKFIEWCKNGPDGAIVDKVLVQESIDETSFDSFKITH